MITTVDEFEAVSEEIDALREELERPRERRAALAAALASVERAAARALQALVEGTGTTAPLQEARSECGALQEAVAALDAMIVPLEARLASAEKAQRAAESLEAVRQREERARAEAFRYEELRRHAEAAKAARERHDVALQYGGLDEAVEAATAWLEAHYAFVRAASEHFEDELGGDLAGLIYDRQGYRRTRELREFLHDVQGREISVGDALHPRLDDLGLPGRIAPEVHGLIHVTPCATDDQMPQHVADVNAALLQWARAQARGRGNN